MRIDSSGNLLVGKTTTASATQGIVALASGSVVATATSDYPLLLNRLTSDGDIAQFRKDGTTVGSIGVTAGGVDTYIGKGNTGLRFYDGSNADGGTGIIVPWNTSTNAARDAQMNLGSSSERYRNLYLSGGVYLGGTGSANKLDDYEEGTFTVSDNNIGEYSDSYGRYTKIGDVVNCFGYFVVPNNSNANTADIYMPFTVGYYAQTHSIGTVLTNEVGNYYLKTSGSNIMAIVDQDESQQTLADFSTKTVRFNVTFHVA
jgi:hypothetical protein